MKITLVLLLYSSPLSRYIMELSLGSYSMVSVSPSLLASSALALSMRLLHYSRLSEVWSETLAHYTR